ncbi:MAG: PEP-CTERM sorting domain-containing protein [Planctomycetota bacterium]
MGSDTGSLDNVVLTPEPSTLLHLGLGAVVLRRKS